jgi:hypothetical protein
MGQFSMIQQGTLSSGSAGYEFFLSIQFLYLEQTNQNLQPKERTKRVCNGCWCLQWLIGRSGETNALQ